MLTAGLFISGTEFAEASILILGKCAVQFPGDANRTPGLLPQLGRPFFLALITLNVFFT